MLAATGGLTHSEISAKARANPEDEGPGRGPEDRPRRPDAPELALLNAWGWVGIGALALVVAAGAVAAAVSGRARVRGWRAAHHGTAIAH